ncbi:hypothetical protein BO70DRAFT_429224 [Aspergillus heteromorphus CBS 117.55]|uniref:Hydrophobin n=1 Tax=Aspergillus heteromorphus CBS 117.55 TaxID=1448321 RepID=A0A317WAY1_9EURO|nr:uncharacterized protein BO70DRAFT_429224 [Aspergillus heteromorphus CBS 117.55]PWY82168.1 hypothetical protein BO70DRAFT_429224 [Aspergillus heteromorphus CBS 117.55]
MQFTIATILGFAIFAAAAPAPAAAGGSKQVSFDEAKGQCSTGDIYCCNINNKEDTSGILNNVLKDGLVLKALIDGSGSSCVSTSLIKDVDLLAFFEKGNDDKDSYCKNTIACCPNGSCEAIGHY